MKTSNIIPKIENGLNDAQRRAVFHENGPLLVLAGPGSGKTRVITYRIACLLARDIAPDRVLGLTFTNKAAQEMVHRVEKLAPDCPGVWLSTFHSFCARILRREGHLLGYTRDFSIYDVDDQKRALKYALESCKPSYKIGVDEARHFIGNCKNRGFIPQANSANRREKDMAKIYLAYNGLLQQNNALDFDDLLLKTLELLTNYKEVLAHYQEKFYHILIDEFQDTNLPQYKIARLLGERHRNVCATGDPDQSIYSWRGANIGNILSFENDYPDAVVIKLEQNYRSTKNILQAASQLISHNRMRKEKTLWTENATGEPIQIRESYDDRDEAGQVCRDIEKLRAKGYSLNEIVVFYRINAQSRAMETELRNRGIPYGIVGGLEFYKRAEVKDLMAYLRVVVNHGDNLSLLRIINVPPRGIGEATCNKLIDLAAQEKLSLWEALQQPHLIDSFAARARKALSRFAQILAEIREGGSLISLVQTVLDKTGYLDHIRTQDREKDEERESNIKEFLSSVYEFEQQFEDGTLAHFLQRVSLIADVDQWEQNTKEGRVTLMTLHSAKGLEFSTVYIIGMVEGLLPHSRSETYEEFEEERRIAFVGITRAKSLLNLSYPSVSYRQGYMEKSTPSRFLEEIPEDICKFIPNQGYHGRY